MVEFEVELVLPQDILLFVFHATEEFLSPWTIVSPSECMRYDSEEVLCTVYRIVVINLAAEGLSLLQ